VALRRVAVAALVYDDDQSAHRSIRMLNKESSPGPQLAFRDSEAVAWAGVRLLDADPELAAGPVDGGPGGPRSLMVPSLRPVDGRWAPPGALARAVGIVVLDGLLVGAGTTFGRPDVRLLGPGDVLDGQTVTRPEMRWRVLLPAHLAVLDNSFVLAARRWPALILGLAGRLSRAQEEQHIRAAICTMPRVEERILALLCHLAHRWGHVTADGITLALPVTHELLGSLVGARRPTVSLALRALSDQGSLRRRDGIWVLSPECSAWPASGIPLHDQPEAP
jgi:CRP/FNR family cyclic AMP-dependent transcriptional regulator